MPCHIRKCFLPKVSCLSRTRCTLSDSILTHRTPSCEDCLGCLHEPQRTHCVHERSPRNLVGYGHDAVRFLAPPDLDFVDSLRYDFILVDALSITKASRRVLGHSRFACRFVQCHDCACRHERQPCKAAKGFVFRYEQAILGRPECSVLGE